jgi:Lrp/AsnC family leucine-responsive transcriptional regulator
MITLDSIDMQILGLLKQNSRMQLKEISSVIHMSGPAVANRISRMEDAGVIAQYTIQVDPKQLGKPLTAIVHVFMKSADHKGFLTYVREHNLVEEAYRISGHGCYALKVIAASHEDLTVLLDHLLQFGNYQLNIAIDKVK